MSNRQCLSVGFVVGSASWVELPSAVPKIEMATMKVSDKMTSVSIWGAQYSICHVINGGNIARTQPQDAQKSTPSQSSMYWICLIISWA